ncbi:MAG: hypothetical protein ACO3J2_08310, partial [Chthoniobacterales bacterium]
MRLNLATLAAVALSAASIGYLTASYQQANTAASSAVKPAAEEPPAWDFGAESLNLVAPASTPDEEETPKSGGEIAKRKKLPLAEIFKELGKLDDAPPGKETNRQERELVEAWAEIDPAAAADYAAKIVALGGQPELLK